MIKNILTKLTHVPVCFITILLLSLMGSATSICSVFATILLSKNLGMQKIKAAKITFLMYAVMIIRRDRLFALCR